MAKQKKSGLTAKERALLKSLGARIRQVRTDRKLDVYEVTGDDLPIKTRQHWQAIEAGKNINLTTAFRVASSLGVRLGVLLGDLG